MATITSLGAGSGLDLESLVTKLVAVESIPLNSLKSKQASYETKISALGSVSSELSKLQTAASKLAAGVLETPENKFASYTASVADTRVASVSASTGAVAGNYSLVVKQLATAAKMTSTAVANSSTSITSTDTTLTLSYGGTDNTIGLSAGASLANLRDAINDKNLGITATLVTGTDGAHLILTGETGASNTVSLDLSSLSSASVPAGSLTMNSTATATDASYTIDGIAGTSSSNTVANAIDGITLTLGSTSAYDSSSATYSATNLTVAKNLSDKITSALDTFVSAYNTAHSTMKTLTAYDAATKTAGTLQGNSTVRMVMGQLRSMHTTTTSGDSTSPFQLFANIGVTIQDNGTLAVDSDKLKTAINSAPSTVANLISNVGKAFDNSIDRMTGTSGFITSASNTLKNIVGDITDKQEVLKRRIDSIEIRYRTQFTALDSLISGLNTTSSFLSSYLSSLNASSSSN